MPFSPAEWAAIAATISAMADVYRIGKETFQVYFDRRINASDINEKARAVKIAFNTYSDEEMEAIRNRIKNCQNHFITESSGEQRRKCLCSVLSDVKDGNGGSIPDQEWQESYVQLNC